MSNYRKADGEEHFRVLPGEDVQLTFPTAGAPPKIVSDKFTIVDFYESKMLEYDSMFVFMPIKELQRLRGMIDPSTGVGYVNAIEIKLRPGADGNAVRDKLKAAFCTAGMLPRGNLARQARRAVGRRADGDHDPQHPAVPDHRRGRLRHPGDLLHDRRGEDPRHRHPQVAGRLGPRRDGHLPHLWAVAGPGRLGRGPGPGADCSCTTSTPSPTAWAG